MAYDVVVQVPFMDSAATLALREDAGGELFNPKWQAATASDAWPSKPLRSGQPWYWNEPPRDSEHWLVEFQNVLSTMQTNYWNGTTWPTTIQWIGAILDTLLAASDRSLMESLSSHRSNISHTNTLTSSLSDEIDRYFSEIEAYYNHEDVNAIFNEAYDDAQWVVLEWLEVIKLIKQHQSYSKSKFGDDDIACFAHRAHIFYNIVQDKFDTSLCDGGLTWNPTLAPYKNTITNELFVSSSVGMYLYFPGDTNTDPCPSSSYHNSTNMTLTALRPLMAHDTALLDNAVKGYQWLKSHGFMNSQGLIADGVHISKGQTTCDEENTMVYTYNQGVILSGLRQLWEATGDSTYLSDGYTLIDTVINATGWNTNKTAEAGAWAGLGRNGIMEDYCDAPANCSQDAQIFKGIYFHHLDIFGEHLPTKLPLIPDLTHVASPGLATEHERRCGGYTPWILHNAQAALSTRDSSGVIGGWWGATYVNQTQSPVPAWAVSLPANSTDIWNEPWVISEPPWACSGQHGCHERSQQNENGHGKTRRDINDQGRGRTVETQGSGLSIVKTACDFTSRYPPS